MGLEVQSHWPCGMVSETFVRCALSLFAGWLVTGNPEASPSFLLAKKPVSEDIYESECRILSKT